MASENEKREENVENEEDTSNINLWEKILSEASRSVSERVDSSNAVFIGDKSSGKSTLLARVQGLDISELKKGVALDYSFIEVANAEDEDSVSRINIWQLEGDSGYSDLLKFAITKENIDRTLLVITLDLSQPWNVLESLKKWLDIAKRHVQSVSQQVPPGIIDEIKSNQVNDFVSYTELSATEEGKSDPSSKTVTKKRKTAEELASIPLPEGALSENLGIPIVVVGCKTDTMVQLEKEYSYKESHFEYIQQYLRRVCLQYGAALIYTSAKKDLNCELFLSYLRHRLYSHPLPSNPQLLEKESIFIPSGADSINKIRVDFKENQTLTNDFDLPFEDVISIPKRLQNAELSSMDPIAVAEDDQEFLIKHRETLEKEEAKDKEKNKSGFLSSLQKLGGTVEAEEPAATTLTSAPTAAASVPTTPAKTAPTLPSTPSASLSQPTEGKGDANDHQVLANFFNSLIHKDRTTGAPRKPTPEVSRTPTKSSTPMSREDIAKQMEKLKQQLNNKNT